MQWKYHHNIWASLKGWPSENICHPNTFFCTTIIALGVFDEQVDVIIITYSGDFQLNKRRALIYLSFPKFSNKQAYANSKAHIRLLQEEPFGQGLHCLSYQPHPLVILTQIRITNMIKWSLSLTCLKVLNIPF